jgi:L-threonylcarbamoyladenylate synthase
MPGRYWAGYGRMPGVDIIERAVTLLRAGGLVGIPTETVYGLAADATQAWAVRRIFATKGRPPTNPLIVHVADAATAARYTLAWPERAAVLAAAFWPGPLTFILPRAPAIVPEVTAGLPNVALRVPRHALTLELLRRFDGALAAPSANRSLRVSPTTAAHVRQELGEAVDLILDGGPCEVGIESTVLDLTGARPAILRPGAVTRAQVEQLIGPVTLPTSVVDSGTPAASPGQQAVHYAPRAPAWHYQRQHHDGLAATVAAASVVVLSLTDPPPLLANARLVQMPATAQAYARVLYATLREADATNPSAILIELPPDEPAWYAVRDRIMRASRLLPPHAHGS